MTLPPIPTPSFSWPDTAPEVEADAVLALQEDIIFGRLAPGARLVEDVLMARFGESRHHVRGVLDRLERLGLVIRERNKGATVRSLTLAQVEQIYAVREMVQRQAALMIPLPAPATLIEELATLNAELAVYIKAHDLRGVHATNDRFHLCLFAACGNEYLLGTIGHYMRLSLPVRAKTLADPASLLASLAEHATMILMLQGTDRWALSQLCVDHLQPSKNSYLAHRDHTRAA